MIKNKNTNKVIKLVYFSFLHKAIIHFCFHSPINLLTNAFNLSSSRTPTNEPSTFPLRIAMTDGTAVTCEQQ